MQRLSHPLTVAPYTLGDKRPPSPRNQEQTIDKRPRIEQQHAPPHEVPNELIHRLAILLLTPIGSPWHQEAERAMRLNLRQLAKLSEINRHWRGAMRAPMQEACVRFTQPFIEACLTPESGDRPSITPRIPALFLDAEIRQSAFKLREFLKALLRADRSSFMTLMTLRALLPELAELNQCQGVPEEEQANLERLPLTVLAFAYQHGLAAQPERFRALVDLLVAHMAAYPIATQVLLLEDLKAICQDDPQLLPCLGEALQRVTTSQLEAAIEARHQALQAVSASFAEDAKAARMHALRKEMAAEPWYPSSPAHVLTLAWIARHWAELPCPHQDEHLRQHELNKAINDLFDQVLMDIGMDAKRSHAAFLFERFPAEALQTAFKRLTRSKLAVLLRRIPVTAHSLPLVAIYAKRFKVDAPERRKMLNELLKEKQSPEMHEALQHLLDGTERAPS